MTLKITATDVWAAEIEDSPNGLARTLTGLADAGARLDCIIARRQADKPGTGVVFVTPLGQAGVRDAAASLGFSEAGRIATLRVEGTTRAGFGARLARAVGDAGINLRGFTGSVIGRKFVCFLGFDRPEDAAAAADAIRALEPVPTATPAAQAS